MPMTLPKVYSRPSFSSTILRLPIGKLTPALRPGEEEGIRQARLLLEKNKTQWTVRHYCPQCQQPFECLPHDPLFRVTPSWDGKKTFLTRDRFQQAALPPRFRKNALVTLPIILGSLMAGHTDRFFDALTRWPEILHEREIWKRTVGLWRKQKIFDTPEGEQAQKHLRTVGRRLAAKPVGRTELPTETKRAENIKESRQKASKNFRARQKAKKA